MTGRGRWRADSDLWPTPEESEWFRRWKSPVAFSPDGRRVAIIHIRNVHLLDAGTGAVSAWADVLDTAGAALAVRFVGDGSALLVATRLGAVVLDVPALLEPAGGRTVPLVQAGPTLYQMQWVAEAEASARGGRAALGMYGDQVAVAVIDPRSTRPVLELSPEREGGELPAVAMSPDGERLAAGFASEGFTSIYEVNDQGQAQ